MLVKDLIKELEQLDQNMQVRLVADHGQYPMQATGIGYGYIDQDSYMPDEIAAEDADEDSIKVVIVEAL